MEGNADRVHEIVNPDIDDTLGDPNLTRDEREKICHIHLKAIESAQESVIRRERWGARFEACLREELQKREEQISSILGHAANRNSRKKENY